MSALSRIFFYSTGHQIGNIARKRPIIRCYKIATKVKTADALSPAVPPQKVTLNSTGILRVPALQVGETCRVYAFSPVLVLNSKRFSGVQVQGQVGTLPGPESHMAAPPFLPTKGISK